MKELSIRFATEEDVPLVLDFIIRLARFEKLEHEVVATEELLRKYMIEEKKVEVIIGECEGKPVSFALFFSNFSTFLGKPGIYLEDLFVDPEYRGHGFGKQMLAYLAQEVIDRDYGRLEWWVLDWNKGAIDFYKSIGAVPMDEWTTFRVTGEALTNLSQELT